MSVHIKVILDFFLKKKKEHIILYWLTHRNINTQFNSRIDNISIIQNISYFFPHFFGSQWYSPMILLWCGDIYKGVDIKVYLFLYSNILFLLQTQCTPILWPRFVRSGTRCFTVAVLICTWTLRPIPLFKEGGSYWSTFPSLQARKTST